MTITLREPTYHEVRGLLAAGVDTADKVVHREQKLAQACIQSFGGADGLDPAMQAKIWNERLSAKARALLREWVDRCIIPSMDERRAFLASARVVKQTETEVQVALRFPECLARAGGRTLVVREPTAGEVRQLLIAAANGPIGEKQLEAARACVVGFEGENTSLSEAGRDELWHEHLCARAWSLLSSWVAEQLQADDAEADEFFRGAAEG
jgi:hypothetical protein